MFSELPHIADIVRAGGAAESPSSGESCANLTFADESSVQLIDHNQAIMKSFQKSDILGERIGTEG